MLHMLMAKHGPDTCPASRPDYREKYMPLMGRIPDAAKKFGVKLEGSWTNMPAHTTYMLVEAPDAQAVCDFAAEVQLMNWNWIDSLLPVITMEEASNRAQTRPL
jgi:hypothetical protein